MSTPSLDLVKQVLAKHDRGEKIRQAFVFAMAELKKTPKLATFRRKSTMRGLFWEDAVAKVIELTDGDPGLHRLDHDDTVSFIFDDVVLLRLKKADFSLQTSNVSTVTADLFDNHHTDLFGFTGIQRVEAVYVPDRFETGIAWTGVVAHNAAGARLWHFELEPPAIVPAATLPLPSPPSAGDLAKVKSDVKVRDRKKNEDGG